MMNFARVFPTVAVLVVVGTTSASALPPVEADARNPVPSCVTPSRLMTYLRSRNPGLDERLANIAAEYRRHGEAVGVRWDYAFFQMMVETASLSFRRADGTPARVALDQYNFAAIGVRDQGAPGRRFANVAAGVQAHVKLLAQHAHHRGDFAELARIWAPDDPRYATNIESVARRFFEGACQSPGRDAEVAGVTIRSPSRPVSAAQAFVPPSRPAPVEVTRAPASDPMPTAGEQLARQAADRAREQGTAVRAGLGAHDAIPVASPESRSAVSVPSMAETHAADDDVKSSGHGQHVAYQRVAAIALLPKPEPPKRAVDPADEAVRTLVSGRTILLDTPVGTQIPIVFREDGSMRGKAGDLASYLGAKIDEGKWWVSQGRLCQKFKVWFDKETQCLTLRQSGQIVHWSSDTGKSGTARFAPRS